VVLTNLDDVATTGVVASVRPGSSSSSNALRSNGLRAAICMAGASHRQPKAPVTGPVQGSGLPVFTRVRTFGLEAYTYDRSALAMTAPTSKAVITQDPQPVSGKQLRSHPPV
jgi:hypothetical protein